MWNLAIVLALSYIIGSIPTSIIVSKWFHGFDIRTKGSGNAGGTNVMRVLGWKLGVLVMAIDASKAVIATTIIARLFWNPNLPFQNRTPFEDFTIIQILCGAAAIIGHIWTIFASFKGGKGIAAGVGMLIGVAPTEAAVCTVVFLIVLFAYKYVSLGSIAASIAFPTTIYFRHTVLGEAIPSYPTLSVFSVLVALLLVFAHRENIKRLLAGNERRISFGSKKETADK